MANLRVERDGDLLRVTLARPDRHNAFDADLIGELAEAFVGVVLLAGFGVGFELLVNWSIRRFMPWYRRDETTN